MADPVHDLTMPHDARYTDVRGCPPNCPVNKSAWLALGHDPALVERICERMHDAYEDAATVEGWSTQAASRKPWADVPPANQRTMRRAVVAALDLLHADGLL